MIGAHVIKRGLSLLLVDLMERGFITHLAGNGAVSIHDFELCLIGETSEDVPHCRHLKHHNPIQWRFLKFSPKIV
jgi:hypothetical protein